MKEEMGARRAWWISHLVNTDWRRNCFSSWCRFEWIKSVTKAVRTGQIGLNFFKLTWLSMVGWVLCKDEILHVQPQLLSKLSVPFLSLHTWHLQPCSKPCSHSKLQFSFLQHFDQVSFCSFEPKYVRTSYWHESNLQFSRDQIALVWIEVSSLVVLLLVKCHSFGFISFHN